jgi:hypothetical protein
MAAMQLKMGSRTVGKVEKRTTSAIASSRSLPRRHAAPAKGSRASKLVCNAVIQTDRPATSEQVGNICCLDKHVQKQCFVRSQPLFLVATSRVMLCAIVSDICTGLEMASQVY